MSNIMKFGAAVEDTVPSIDIPSGSEKVRKLKMLRFGDCIVGASNNWKRNHGFPMTETKRYPHMRKDMPKHVRIRYYAMFRAGCDMEFIKRNLKSWNGFDLEKAN